MDGLDILHAIPDLYLILNTRFEIVEVSDAYLRATKVKREDIIGKGIFEIFPANPDDPNSKGVENLTSSLERVLRLKIPDTMAVQRYDIRKPEEEGGEYEEHFWSPVNTPVLGPNNEVQYIIHRVEDVTEYVKLKEAEMAQHELADKLLSHMGEMETEIYKRAQEIQETNKKLRIANEELEHHAYFDGLTGLANRKQLYHRIKQFLEMANRIGTKVAILFLDLDQFKLINDTLGHKVGDLLLQIVSKRVTEEVQLSDLVARLGGDEFVILLNNIKDASDVAMIAQRILHKINSPFNIENHKLFVSGSVGISIYPDNGKDEITLLKHADIAMYAAKQTGRNNYQFCTQDMIHKINNKVNLEKDLREALQKHKFLLYYQPQVDLKTGKITSIEALARFTREDGSIALPRDFMFIAEGTGLIVAIGEWVLYTACHQYQVWKNKLQTEHNAVAENFKIAVNFSARQLKEPGFLEMVKKTLEKTNFLPENLEFEITEHLMISDVEISTKVIQELKDLGINIVLDDFGVGYSSLSYLREFPINKLKIDRSLFRRVPTDPTDSEIINSIIRMAHAMQIAVVAEGVESKKQIQFLIDHECDIVQSHFFSKPVPADELSKVMFENPAWNLVLTD